MTPLLRLRARPLLLGLVLLGLGCLTLALTGCVSDQARADIAASAQTSFVAAQSLPPSAQQQAIEANQLAIASAVGLPFTPAVPTTAAAVAPGTAPGAAP